MTCIYCRRWSATSNCSSCSGTTLNLNATRDRNCAFDIHTWSGTGTFPNGGTANATVSGAATGTYNVAVSNACGNVNQNVSVTVNPLPTPTISAGGPTTFCAGGSVTLTSTAGGSYLWSPGGQTTQAIAATSSGTYSVQVTTNGCSGTKALVRRSP